MQYRTGTGVPSTLHCTGDSDTLKTADLHGQHAKALYRLIDNVALYL